MDSEILIDETTMKICPRCGSSNITTDLSTNKIICNDCADKNWQEPKKQDIALLNEKELNHEQMEIYKALKRGNEITI
jgi:hypothetical protein